MAVLDYFYFIFKTDASDVKKGADEAQKVTTKLQETLNATDAVSNKLGSSFKNLIHHAAGAFLAFASAGALVHGIRAAREYTDQLGELSETLNINIEDLSAWADAVASNGGSAEGFQQTVRNMISSLQDLVVKGHSRAEPFFKQLGVHMTDAAGKARDLFDILPDIAGSFEKLSKTEAYGIGQGLGLDNGTILLLQKGRLAVEQIIAKQRELGVITEKDANVVKRFNDGWKLLNLEFRTLFVRINSFILPAVTKVIEFFGKMFSYFEQHKHLMIGGIIALGATITAFLLPPLLAAGAAAIVAMAPFILLGALISGLVGAFALIYEDFQVFKEGGVSAIGEIVKKWPVLGQAIVDFIRVLGILWDVASGVFLLLFEKPGKAIEKFNEIVRNAVNQIFELFPGLKAAVDEVGNAFQVMGAAVEGVWNAIVAAIKAAISVVTGAVDAVSNGYHKVKSALGLGGSEDTTKTLAEGKSYLDLAANSPISSQSSNTIMTNNRAANKSTSVQTGDITIQTQATDANGIANSLNKELLDQMRQAINNFDDGVAA